MAICTENLSEMHSKQTRQTRRIWESPVPRGIQNSTESDTWQSSEPLATEPTHDSPPPILTVDDETATWHADPNVYLSPEFPKMSHFLSQLNQSEHCHLAGTLRSHLSLSDREGQLMSPWRHVSLYPSTSTLSSSLSYPATGQSFSVPSSFVPSSSSAPTSSSIPSRSSSSLSPTLSPTIPSSLVSFPSSIPSSSAFTSSLSFSSSLSPSISFSRRQGLLLRFVCTTPLGTWLPSHVSSQESSSPLNVNNLYGLPRTHHVKTVPYNCGFLPQTCTDGFCTDLHCTEIPESYSCDAHRTHRSCADRLSTDGSGTERFGKDVRFAKDHNGTETFGMDGYYATHGSENYGTGKHASENHAEEKSGKSGQEKPGIEKTCAENCGSEKCGTEKCATGKCGSGNYSMENSGSTENSNRAVHGAWAPVEVVDIGVRAASAGEVYLVRAVAGVRTGGVWRVVGIAEDDAMSPLLRGLRDVTAFMPGRMEALESWLERESPVQTIVDEKQVMDIVQQAHSTWHLHGGHCPTKSGFLSFSASWHERSSLFPNDTVNAPLTFGQPSDREFTKSKSLLSVSSPSRKRVLLKSQKSTGSQSLKSEHQHVSILGRAKGAIIKMAGKVEKVSHGVANLISGRHMSGRTVPLEKRHSLDEASIRRMALQKPVFENGVSRFSRRSLDGWFGKEEKSFVAKDIVTASSK